MRGNVGNLQVQGSATSLKKFITPWVRPPFALRASAAIFCHYHGNVSVRALCFKLNYNQSFAIVICAM